MPAVRNPKELELLFDFSLTFLSVRLSEIAIFNFALLVPVDTSDTATPEGNDGLEVTVSPAVANENEYEVEPIKTSAKLALSWRIQL